MSVVLLDTTVVSLLHPKKRGSELLDRYAVHMAKQTLALSFQSVAELWYWPNPGGGVTRLEMDSIALSDVSSSFLTTTRSHRCGRAQCSPARRKVAGSSQGTVGLSPRPFTSGFLY